MSHGPLVVELLTQAARLGFTLEYRPRAPHDQHPIAIVTAPPTVTHEQRQIEHDLQRHQPDIVEVLARTCTVRTCTHPTSIREYGTDLPWCHHHAGPRGLMLLHQERPDLFPNPTDHHGRPALTQETAA